MADMSWQEWARHPQHTESKDKNVADMSWQEWARHPQHRESKDKNVADMGWQTLKGDRQGSSIS